MEQTLVLIKPKAVERGLVGKIITRFEDRGLHIKLLKMLKMTPEMADSHYSQHKNKPFYPELQAFMTSGPLVAMVLEGENIIAQVRQMAGPTNPMEASPGTIRSDYSTETRCNVLHASDCPESAAKEISIFFKE